jgi:biopolymer transport protein ExbB
MDEIFDIVDVVLYFLALLSVVVWAVAIAKAFMFFRLGRQNRRFLQAFAEVQHLRSLAGLAKSAKGSLARICQSGMNELLSIQENHVAFKHQREMLIHALRSQAHIEQHRMEKGLAILASIGSTAPFIGLFGTVWGIMNALTDISASGSAGLDVVAGPIGEALIATAIGIATAVPAVLAYNYFLRKVKVGNAQMEQFGSAFQYLSLKSGLGGE